jgi:RNA polymerase primary sigma factor
MQKINSSKQTFADINDTLSMYLKEISKEELLSSEEELELSKRIKDGDEIAKERLIKSNLRFVITVAKQYQHSGLPLHDLINEGNLGMIKAAEKFDETKGFKFISYAVWWIRQSILQAINSNGKMVRLPLNKIDAKNKIKKAKKNFIREHDREPSIDELANELDYEIHFIESVLNASNEQSYLSDPISSDESCSLIDTIENENSLDPEKSLSTESLKSEIDKSFNALTEQEVSIIKMYFGIGYDFRYSCEDIGEIYNMGSERIRQLKDIAIRRLKFSSKNLQKYF